MLRNPSMSSPPQTDVTTVIASRYAAIRARTVQLATPLSAEDCCAQSMPDASPVKWHLAHTTWFFETFLLEKFEPAFQPFQAEFRVLFNSYYNGIGDKHPRVQRGLLTRPSLAEVLAYRHNVDERMQVLIAHLGNNKGASDETARSLITLGLHHEQQHQELILTDVKHLLSMNPLKPRYRDPVAMPTMTASAPQWIAYDGGIVAVGAHANANEAGAKERFCFDNELPRHDALLQPYLLASRPVTNREYMAFIASGGYGDAALWLSEGWDWINAHGVTHPATAITHPLYWQSIDGAWSEFSLSGMVALEPDAPVSHVSYFEADAFARWSGARLPTESEWEHAAAACAIEGNFADDGHLRPLASAPEGLSQMFGNVWEWTQSSYAPYPGYRPATGAIGEYNGKFMVNQYVLRGGSCATPRDHIRASYRNFFPATARWQFSGIRLAKDAG